VLPVSGPAPAGIAVLAGSWKVTLISYNKADEYLDEFASPALGWHPKAVTNTLLIVRLLVQNTANQAVNVLLSRACPGSTGLIDTSGECYVPIRYDSRVAGAERGLYSFPPDSNTRVAVICEVPRALVPREMRLTIVEAEAGLG
jgi:hypothetical protein